MYQETYVIGKVRYTMTVDKNRMHVEAYRRKCTGHGNTAAEALLDLRKKIKEKIKPVPLIQNKNP